MFDNHEKLNVKLREVLDLLDENLKKIGDSGPPVVDDDLQKTIVRLMQKNEEYTRQLASSLSQKEPT